MKSERLAQRLLLTARGDDAGRRSDDDNRDASNGLIFGPEGGSQFFHAGHPVGAYESARAPAEKYSQASGVLVTRLVSLPTATLLPSIPKATFM